MPESRRLKKVLLAGRVNTVGGSAQVVRMLHAGLLKRGIEARAVFPLASRTDLEAWYGSTGLQSEFTDGLARAADRTSFWKAMRLLRFLRGQDFDVLNIHFSGVTFSALDVLPAALLLRKPVVVSLHTFSPGSKHGFKSRMNTRLAGHAASKVVVLSRFQKELARSLGVPAGKMAILPNCVDIESLESKKSDRDYREGASFVIGTMCRQEVDKRVMDLARAFSDSPAFMAGGRWIVAGSGSLFEANQKEAKALLGGRVEFYGHIEDHATFYKSLDLYAMVSDSEAFNLTYIEAGHFGVPSLATAVGGAPEFILPGETGELIPPGALAQITAAVEQHMSPDFQSEEVRSRSKARVDAEFTLESFVQRYLELYESLN